MDIGVIAESNSDIDVLEELTKKFLNKRRFTMHRFNTGGCGAMLRKCPSATRNFLIEGCTHIVVMHDLDNKRLIQLRKSLRSRLDPVAKDKYLLLIPIREIEAWLLCDANAIKTVFKMEKLPRVPASPHLDRDPKSTLSKIVKLATGKRYVTTLYNRQVAAAIRLDRISKCDSFRPYRPYIENLDS